MTVSHLRRSGLAERERDREVVQVDAECGAAQLGVVAAAEPGGHLHHVRPAVGAEPDLGVARAVLDPERGDRGLRPPRPRPRPACALGHAWASATPKAGGSARILSVTVSGTNRPSTETAFTVSSGPSISSSTSTPPPRDSAAAVATAAARSAGSRTSVSPRWPWRSAALTTQGNVIPGSLVENVRGWSTPAAANRSRWRVFVVASTAVAPLDRMRQPEPLGDAGGDPDRPVGAGRDDPVDRSGPREPLDPRLVLGRDHRALVREREPGRERVAVDGDHRQVTGRSRLEQAELRRAGA